MDVPTRVKGTIPFREFRTWYSVTGERGAGRPALVAVHGGPGSTHDYLRPLTALAEHGWPVVLYDQLGNGGSTHLPDRGADFWTPQLFLDELDTLLRALDVADDYVLFGQSWGGLLGAAHAAERPAGLRGLVIANSTASYPLWRAEMERLRADLPAGVDDVLRRHEAAGTTDSREYFEAMTVFYGRHVCRLDPWPRDYLASFLEIADNPTVYRTMNGPSEFHVIGTLRDWGVEDVLPRIAVPTLVLRGRHDEATEACNAPFLARISDVDEHVFAESSHVPHLEEPAQFEEVLLRWLKGL